MTSSAIIQAAASTRTAPSREFMVQQAVLDALAALYKISFPRFGAASCALDMEREFIRKSPWANVALNVVRLRYRRIAAEYQVSP